MNTLDIWTLAPAHDLSHLVKWDKGVSFAEPVMCPINPDHQRPGPRIGNLRVVLPQGPPADIVWTWFSECLIQDEVRRLLQRERITGYEVRPVEARFEGTNDPAPRFWELVVTGWGGVAPPESGVRVDRKRSCAACGHVVYSTFTNPQLLFDLSRWDGSDLFFVWPLPRTILATGTVVQLIRFHALEGAVLRPLSALRSTGETLSPGPLSNWLPPEKAQGLDSLTGL